MQKKAFGIVFVCLVLLAAIVAGYWDMLSTEKLRLAEREESPPVTVGAAQSGDTTSDAGEGALSRSDSAAAGGGGVAGTEPEDVANTEDDGREAGAADRIATRAEQAVSAAEGADTRGAVADDVGAAAASEPNTHDDTNIARASGAGEDDAVSSSAKTKAAASAADTIREPSGALQNAPQPLAGTNAEDHGGDRTEEANAASGDARAAAGDDSAAAGADAIRAEGDASGEAGSAPAVPANGRADDAGQTERGIDAADAAADAGTSSADAAAVTSQAEAAAVPRFDLLRVEPDGSAVIAGRAPAESRIALLSEEMVLGRETAGPGGDFAVVLDVPLAPGDHAITIRAIAPDGTTTHSVETAIVSVPPRERPGELLAMIEAPDAPTRLIEMPAGDRRAAAKAGRVGGRSDTMLPSAGGDGQGASAAPSTDTGGTSGSDVTGARLRKDETPSDVGEDTGARRVTAVPDAKTTDTAEDAVAGGAASGSLAPAQSEGVVMLPRESQEKAAPLRPASVPLLRVEAVEVEGSQVYIAGAAERGTRVRVYVDNVFLAEDLAGFGDRFLVTGDTGMSVGEHLVRADQLSADGRVVARAEVPFTRPEGANAAGVAPASAVSAGTGESSGEAGSVDGTATDAPDMPVPAPDTTVAGTPESEAPETMRAARDAGTPGATAPSDQALADATIGEAMGDPVTTKAEADDGASARRAPASAEAPAAARQTPSRPDSETARLSMDAGEESPVAEGSERAVPVNRQPALASADGRVIIRKGDTLWEISRRTYGSGQSYTVIYLANGDQIRDPDLIYPAQVFRLPETPANGQERAGDEAAGQD